MFSGNSFFDIGFLLLPDSREEDQKNKNVSRNMF